MSSGIYQIIKVFDSLSTAERETGILHSNISSVCTGKLKTTGGYKWKHLDNE